jgi:hypothetical protein
MAQPHRDMSGNVKPLPARLCLCRCLFYCLSFRRNLLLQLQLQLLLLLLLLSLLHLLLLVLRCHSERSEEPLYFAFVLAVAVLTYRCGCPILSRTLRKGGSAESHPERTPSISEGEAEGPAAEAASRPRKARSLATQ